VTIKLNYVLSTPVIGLFFKGFMLVSQCCRLYFIVVVALVIGQVIYGFFFLNFVVVRIVFVTVFLGSLWVASVSNF